MNEQVKDTKQLQELLKKHTGSKSIPRSLEYDLQIYPASYGRAYYNPGFNSYYIAYSRGASTLIFSRKDMGNSSIPPTITLLDVIPKVSRSNWVEGIDAPILTAIMPIINQGGKILASYPNKIKVSVPEHLTATLPESEIVKILSLGFKRYIVYNVEGYFEM